MTINAKLFLCLLCCAFLQGCSLRSPQVEIALAQVQALLDSRHDSEREMFWLATFNDQGAILKPYVADGYTVFANESGDAVAFDGWVVRSVLGFGREHPLTISDDGWVRTSRMHASRFSATCSEWQRGAVDRGYQWSQTCGVNGHETVIDIDESGSVNSIEQAFGGDLGTLSLRLHR